MKKLIYSSVLLTLTSLGTLGQIKEGTGEFLTYNKLRFEIIDRDLKTVGVATQEADCPTFVDIPSSIMVEEGDSVSEKYSVVQINPEAFKENRNLFKVKFAATITDIGDRAFEGCEIVNFEELPEQLLTIGDYAFKGCKAITKIKLPETTERLGEGCFIEMPSLKRAILFSNVTEIPDRAFYDNDELEEVYLPEKLVKIGNEAFSDCANLTEITFPSTLEEIGQYAFAGGAPTREGLKHVVLPPSVKNISQAFFNAGLYSVDLGDLEYIPEQAFGYCYCLSEVVFPKNLKSIGRNAFSSCAANAGRSMINLILPETVETIEEDAFNETNIVALSIGDLVESLPARSCGAPQILRIGEGIRTIHPEAFNFDQLKILEIKAMMPPTVEGGFPADSDRLYDILLVVPNEEAKELYSSHEYWKDFHIVLGNEELVEVELNGSTDIATAVFTKSGLMPAEVTKLKVAGHLSEKDLLLIKENMLSLRHLDMSETDNEIIPSNAFEGKVTLETVILPKNLKRIEEHAFEGCSTMDMPGLPDEIESIMSYAFSGCASLSITKMPEALREIGYYAFGDCVSLNSITFGDQLETLHGTTFAGCDNIVYVDMSRSVKLRDLSFNTFYLCFRLSTLLLPDSIENIGYACIANTALKSIELPGSLKTLDEYAIHSNPLRVITFEEGLTELPKGALANNSKLLTVNLPSTLTALHPETFQGNKKIAGISCMALEAPETTAATFEEINTRTCLLSVPVTSFFSYLSATGWGMFSHISNSLEIDIPADIEVTTIPEEDYQDLVEEEESSAREQENIENTPEETEPLIATLTRGEEEDAPVEVTPVEKEEESLLSGHLFCKLNHGSVLASEENEDSKGHRIFIRSKDGKPITSITVNGEEMIEKLEGNSLLLPTGSIGKLIINGGNVSTAVDEIPSTADPETICDVYSLTGQKLYTGSKGNLTSILSKGIYILRPLNGAKSEKIVIK